MVVRQLMRQDDEDSTAPYSYDPFSHRRALIEAERELAHARLTGRARPVPKFRAVKPGPSVFGCGALIILGLILLSML